MGVLLESNLLIVGIGSLICPLCVGNKGLLELKLLIVGVGSLICSLC